MHHNKKAYALAALEDPSYSPEDAFTAVPSELGPPRGEPTFSAIPELQATSPERYSSAGPNLDLTASKIVRRDSAESAPTFTESLQPSDTPLGGNPAVFRGVPGTMRHAETP